MGNDWSDDFSLWLSAVDESGFRGRVSVSYSESFGGGFTMELSVFDASENELFSEHVHACGTMAAVESLATKLIEQVMWSCSDWQKKKATNPS